MVDGKEITKPEIPLPSIKESVINSFCHSSFDERMTNAICLTPVKVDIFNSASFPYGYKPKDFAYNGVESVVRNPLISKILYYANYVDLKASGFRKIFDSLIDVDINVIPIVSDEGFKMLFIRNEKEGECCRESHLLKLIRNYKSLTLQRLYKLALFPKELIEKTILNLEKEEKIKRVRIKRTEYWELA